MSQDGKGGDAEAPLMTIYVRIEQRGVPALECKLSANKDALQIFNMIQEAMKSPPPPPPPFGSLIPRSKPVPESNDVKAIRLDAEVKRIRAMAAHSETMDKINLEERVAITLIPPEKRYLKES